MKTLFLFLFAALLANIAIAQNEAPYVGLECNKTYHFQQAIAWHRGQGEAFDSEFTFYMRNNGEMFYYEVGRDSVHLSLGKPTLMKKYEGENGLTTYLYQCRNVRLEYVIMSSTTCAIGITYADKKLVFHQVEENDVAAHKRNRK